MVKAGKNLHFELIDVNSINVISHVVKQNLCTGCGICATICPTGSLTMYINEHGEFVPILSDGCKNCALCSSVCPQLSKNYRNICMQNIMPNKSSHILGYSNELKTWAGYATDSTRRFHSASGGMLTLLLKYLLESHQIDVAIVVSSANPDNGLLFEAKLVHTDEELDQCAGSKYYPIELSKALKELRSTNERAAIVGLPCHVSAIRLLMEKSESFKEIIRYIFGLTCGHGVSTHFTDVLIAATGASPESLDTVAYRGKQGMNTSSDFVFSAYRNSHSIGKTITFDSTVYGNSWRRRLFVPQACDFCEDCFAQNADVTFMDAWLPEYVKDPRGMSMIVSRNAQVNEILKCLSNSGLANLWPVTTDDIVRSQAGVIHYKRELLPDRVFSAISHGKEIPEHLKMFSVKGTRTQRKENNRYKRYRQISGFLWRLNLPARVRIGMIMYLTGPGIFRRYRVLLVRIISQEVKTFVKGILRWAGIVEA